MATFLINKCFIVDVSSLREPFPSKISIIKEEEEKQTVSRQIWVQVLPCLLTQGMWWRNTWTENLLGWVIQKGKKPCKNCVEKIRRANVCLLKTSNIAIRGEIRPSKAWKLKKMEQNLSTLFYTLFYFKLPCCTHDTEIFIFAHPFVSPISHSSTPTTS